MNFNYNANAGLGASKAATAPKMEPKKNMAIKVDKKTGATIKTATASSKPPAIVNNSKDFVDATEAQRTDYRKIVSALEKLNTAWKAEHAKKQPDDVKLAILRSEINTLNTIKAGFEDALSAQNKADILTSLSKKIAALKQKISDNEKGKKFELPMLEMYFPKLSELLQAKKTGLVDDSDTIKPLDSKTVPPASGAGGLIKFLPLAIAGFTLFK